MVWVRCPVWEGTEVAEVLARVCVGRGTGWLPGKCPQVSYKLSLQTVWLFQDAFGMTLIHLVRLSPPLPPHPPYTLNTECSVGPGPSSDSPGNELVLLLLRQVAHLRPQG